MTFCSTNTTDRPLRHLSPKPPSRWLSHYEFTKHPLSLTPEGNVDGGLSWLVGTTIDLSFTRSICAPHYGAQGGPCYDPASLVVLEVAAKVAQYVDYTQFCRDLQQSDKGHRYRQLAGLHDDFDENQLTYAALARNDRCVPCNVVTTDGADGSLAVQGLPIDSTVTTVSISVIPLYTNDPVIVPTHLTRNPFSPEIHPYRLQPSPHPVGMLGKMTVLLNTQLFRNGLELVEQFARASFPVRFIRHKRQNHSSHRIRRDGLLMLLGNVCVVRVEKCGLRLFDCLGNAAQPHRVKSAMRGMCESWTVGKYGLDHRVGHFRPVAGGSRSLETPYTLSFQALRHHTNANGVADAMLEAGSIFDKLFFVTELSGVRKKHAKCVKTRFA